LGIFGYLLCYFSGKEAEKRAFEQFRVKPVGLGAPERQLTRACHTAAQAAGIEKHVSPHTLRCSQLLDPGPT
jgi:site-specific recombinase XerD